MTSTTWDFPASELEDALKRAFVDNEAKYIWMDGHSFRSNFLRQSVNYGIEQGWLTQGEDLYDVHPPILAQWTAWTYFLTDDGKEHFGINQNE